MEILFLFFCRKVDSSKEKNNEKGASEGGERKREREKKRKRERETGHKEKRAELTAG